jgi:hypothetical protein
MQVTAKCFTSNSASTVDGQVPTAVAFSFGHLVSCAILLLEKERTSPLHSKSPNGVVEHMSSTFGQYLENRNVVIAALDVDENAINEFDIGETSAFTATEVRTGKLARKSWEPGWRVPGEDELVEYTPVAGIKGSRMTARELRELEAMEAAEDAAELAGNAL